MAGFEDQYPHLPGHLTEYKDGGMQLTKEVNPPETDSVLILGTSTDGPIMEPVKVDSETFESVFGKTVDDNGSPNGATLPQAFEEAYAAGCRDIRLMRISGTTASYTLEGTATSKTNDAVFEGILGASLGNSMEKSVFYTQDEATEIIEVTADGVVVSPENYDVTLNAAVPDKFVGTDEKEYATADLINIKIVTGTKTIVEAASEDIYKNDSTEALSWEHEIDPGHDGYTIALQAGIDYVVKGKTIASEAYIDNATNTFEDVKVAPGDIFVTPLEKTKIALHDAVCNNGSYIVIKYETPSGDVPVENASDVSGTFVANGEDQEFVIEDEEGNFLVPVSGTTKIYFDGLEYNELDLITDSTTPIFKVVKFTEDKVAKAKVVINPGKHAKLGSKIDTRFLYKNTVTYIPELTLESTFGGEVYNESTVQVDSITHPGNFVEKVLKITKPKSKRNQVSEDPLTYSSVDYPTFALLIRAINADSNNSAIFKAYCSKDIEATPTTKLNALPTAKNFKGGSNGLNITSQEKFECLSGKKDAAGGLIDIGAYQLLENYTVDSVVVADTYADEELVGKYDNFAYELALFCAVSSYRNHTTLGFIQTSSPNDTGLKAVEEHVKKLESYNNYYYMKDTNGEIILDSENKPMDLGRYITVLAGGDNIFYNTRLGNYACNSAAAFAGYVSTLDVQSAPTNKAVGYSQGLKFKYSNAQLERLTANRLVTYKYKGNGTTVAIVDAMTCAAPGSDYERLSSMRAVRVIANDIRTVADPFLGQPNTVQQRNALSALIDKKLGQHKEAGTIQDYSFNVVATVYDELVGQAKIELTLVPSQELRRITTVISLKPSI